MKLLLALLLLAAPALVRADTVPSRTLKLTAAGQGARKPLRFVPTKGAKRTVVITSQESTARGLLGKLPPLEASPSVRTTFEVEVKDVTTDGDIHYEFTYQKSELVADKSTSPDLARQLTAGLAAFVGLKGQAVVTSRGITKELELVPPANATPLVQQATAVARGMMSQIIEPLPEEAIGVGAKWQTSSTVTVDEITAQTTVNHELVALADTRATIKMTLTVHGKGSRAGNLTTETSASGETTLDLTSIAPLQAKLALRTTIGLDMDGKRMGQLVTQKMTVVSH